MVTSINRNRKQTLPPPVLDPEQLWYVPDPKLRTKSAAENAIRVADWILAGKEGPDPNEQELFIALHSCAYRAARRERKRPIPQEERYEWARRWQRIREHIVEKNMGLVYSMIARFGSRNVDEDDMLSDALFALARAVDRFNPWRGYRFSTYACNVIARALMRRGKQESHYRKRFPVQHDVSFERPARSPDDQTELYVERLHLALSQNLGELTELESRILSQRFPSQREDRLTFQEIGDAIGLSKERVRQIQNIALGKLREALSEDPALR
jgi:RNA polymerase sigma factor (sigma-70 family)